MNNDEVFAVTAARGFLPVRDPLSRLTAGTSPLSSLTSPLHLFHVLEGLGDDLPKLLLCGSATVRAQIESRLSAVAMLTLPPVLTSDEEERLFLLLSFVAHAYVWGRTPSTSTIMSDSEEDPTSGGALHDCDWIPKSLADLWIEVARRRGRPPILTYATFNLFNWRRLDASKPVELGNIACLNNFLGGQDEEWFRCVHVEIESQSAGAVGAILRYVEQSEALQGNRGEGGSGCSLDWGNVDGGEGERSSNNDWDGLPLAAPLVEALEEIQACLCTIQRVLRRMNEACDPHIYYHRVRLYMSGWRNNPSLPKGLRYGPEGERRQYYGETGAQSCILPAFDAFLGIEHEKDSMREYLLDMRDYVPPAHLSFLLRLEAHRPLVRDVVKKRGLLRAAYNDAIKALANFRALHLHAADTYIRKPAPTELLGTGGSDFRVYLRKHREETKMHAISLKSTDLGLREGSKMAIEPQYKEEM